MSIKINMLEHLFMEKEKGKENIFIAKELSLLVHGQTIKNKKDS